MEPTRSGRTADVDLPRPAPALTRARLAGSGVVVPGSGGVRKLRWSAEGRGKRGGLRVIYYLLLGRGQIRMLTIYGKSVRENIPAHLLKQMKKAIEDAKDD